MGDSDYKMRRKGRSESSRTRRKSPHKEDFKKWLINWVSKIILGIEVHKMLNQTKQKIPEVVLKDWAGRKSTISLMKGKEKLNNNKYYGSIRTLEKIAFRNYAKE